MNKINTNEFGAAAIMYVKPDGDGMNVAKSFKLASTEAKASFDEHWEKTKAGMLAEGIDVNGPQGNPAYMWLSMACVTDMKEESDTNVVPIEFCMAMVSHFIDSPYWAGDCDMCDGTIAVTPLTKEEFDKMMCINLTPEEIESVSNEAINKYRSIVEKASTATPEEAKKLMQSKEFRDVDFVMHRLNKIGVSYKSTEQNVQLKAPIYIGWIYDEYDDCYATNKVTEGVDKAKSKIRETFLDIDKQHKKLAPDRPDAPSYMLTIMGNEDLAGPKKMRKWMSKNSQLVSDINLIWITQYWTNHKHDAFKTRHRTNAMIATLFDGRLSGIQFDVINNVVKVGLDETNISLK